MAKQQPSVNEVVYKIWPTPQTQHNARNLGLHGTSRSVALTERSTDRRWAVKKYTECSSAFICVLFTAQRLSADLSVRQLTVARPSKAEFSDVASVISNGLTAALGSLGSVMFRYFNFEVD